MASGFANYDFANDSAFTEYLNKLEFVGNQNEQLLKAKKKYYQRYIDPTFNISDDRSSSNNNANNNNNNNNNHSSVPPQQNPTPQQPNQRVFRFQTAWIVAHLFLLINIILYLLPFFGSYFSYSCYYRATLSAIFAYGISLINSIGIPQFSRSYLERAVQNDNFHYVILCLTLYISYPLTIIVFSIAIYSLLALSNYIVNTFSHTIPVSYRPKYSAFVEPYLRKILNKQSQLLGYAAYFEVVSLPIALVSLLTGNGSILLVIGYYMFLNYRFVTSGYVQSVVYSITAQLDTLFYHPMCPTMLGAIYTKIKTFMRSSVQARYRQ